MLKLANISIINFNWFSVDEKEILGSRTQIHIYYMDFSG